MENTNEVYTGKKVVTHWELRSYDVWGNSEDGYEVNDSFCYDHNFELKLKVIKCNVNFPGKEFEYAFPSDYQLGKIFGFTGKLDITGDDTHIYVNRESDGYPLGEMYCTSHKSLSPIRE